jgi:hypothetical protein
MTKRWEDYHVEDFQALPAVVLPRRLPESAITRLHELGAIAAQRESDGKVRRHGTALHWKYYLQAHGFIYEDDPDLVKLLETIVREADAQNWKLLAEEPDVHVRLIEYHHYCTGGDLTVGFDKHYDGGR